MKRKASSYDTVMGLNGCVPQANRAITTSFMCVCLKRLLPCAVVARQEADDVLYWKDSLVGNIAPWGQIFVVLFTLLGRITPCKIQVCFGVY